MGVVRHVGRMVEVLPWGRSVLGAHGAVREQLVDGAGDATDRRGRQQVGARWMIPRRQGRIVNIASIAGLKGALPEHMRAIAYHTSKGGLVNFTRALAGEWGQFGITVNAICPGFMPSKMSQGLLEKIGPRVIAETPLRQLGDPSDLEGLVVLLSSSAARHITGQIIAVDGGASVV